MCTARKTEHQAHRQEGNTSTTCRVMLPAVLRTENTREGVTSHQQYCLKSYVWKTKWNQNPNPNPTTLMLVSARVTGVFSGGEWGSSCRDQDNGGTLNSGQKALMCELQHSDGPAAILAQPSMKEMLGFMLAQKKKKKHPQSIPKGHQKAVGSVTQRFPIAFWAVQPYLAWMTRLALSFLTNLQMDLLSPQILRIVTLTLSP